MSNGKSLPSNVTLLVAILAVVVIGGVLYLGNSGSNNAIRTQSALAQLQGKNFSGDVHANLVSKEKSDQYPLGLAFVGDAEFSPIGDVTFDVAVVGIVDNGGVLNIKTNDIKWTFKDGRGGWTGTGQATAVPIAPGVYMLNFNSEIQKGFGVYEGQTNGGSFKCKGNLKFDSDPSNDPIIGNAELVTYGVFMW